MKRVSIILFIIFTLSILFSDVASAAYTRTRTYDSSGWARLSAYYPDNNYGGTTPAVRTDDNSPCSGFDYRLRGVLKFDTINIPSGSTINSAVLNLTPNGNYLVGTRSHIIRRATTSWDASTVTWNTQPSTTDTDSQTISVANGLSVHSWNNLVNVVSGWVNGGFSNYGVHLMDVNECDGSSSEQTYQTPMRFTITYTNNINSAPTVPSLTTHSNYHSSASTTVSWSASTDTDGDSITYDVKVGTASGGTNVINQVGDGATGSTSSTSSNSFTMTPTNTYYWSARACDGYTCSAWATESSFAFTNSAPVMSSNVVTPSPNVNNWDTLTDTPSATDSDGDTVTYTYQWYKDGSAIGGATSSTLSPPLTAGSIYKVLVTPYDGYGYGTGTYSNQVVIKAIPPIPANINSTTGNFWVNTTWSAGAGNVTDSYNVSVNSVWHNGSTNFYNSTLSAHAWQNVTVYAYNASGTGTLSTSSISLDTQIPNNAVSIGNISSTYYINPGDTLKIFSISLDADSDTPTFATNANKGTFYTNNGTLAWTAVANDSGTYNWHINVTDGYGSVATKSFSVSVNSSIPGAATYLANTTGNYWVNYTWTAGVSTDLYNVSVNGTWTNGSVATFKNTTGMAAHGSANIMVLGYNTSSGVVGNSSSQNTQVPDNLPVYGSTSISNAAIYTTGSTTIEIDNVTDADNDTITIVVGVTLLGGNEVNNTMVQTAGTSNWTYPFSTLTTGTYTVTHFYISTAYGNVTKSDTLQFTVATGGVGTGGGGGGGSSSTTIIVTGSNATNVTPLLLLQNLTTGATEPEIEAISKCITEGLFMANSCSGNNFGIQVTPANYWIFLGGVIAGISVVSIQVLRGKKRDWLPDSLLYGAVTIIIVIALEFVGVNMYFLNYIVDSPKYAWAFFSVTAWGLFISAIGDYLSYRERKGQRKKVYVLKDLSVDIFQGRSQ